MIIAIIKKKTTFLYIKFDISGSGQLGLTSGWLRSQQPFIHHCYTEADFGNLEFVLLNFFTCTNHQSLTMRTSDLNFARNVYVKPNPTHSAPPHSRRLLWPAPWGSDFFF